jgi:transposase
MRGDDEQSGHLFSYVSPEHRVPADHPLRAIRAMTDEALERLSPRFARLYATTGRPSIPPEHLLRALLLQVLYSVRSERMLMEQLEYNLLFRWFVGLGMDDPVWAPTTFTKNRDRLLDGDIARAFFEDVVAQARGRRLLSGEHFTVDGTLLEAWAGLKSFKRKDQHREPPDDPENPTVDFHGERRSNQTHQSTTELSPRTFCTFRREFSSYSGGAGLPTGSIPDFRTGFRPPQSCDVRSSVLPTSPPAARARGVLAVGRPISTRWSRSRVD